MGGVQGLEECASSDVNVCEDAFWKDTLYTGSLTDRKIPKHTDTQTGWRSCSSSPQAAAAAAAAGVRPMILPAEDQTVHVIDFFIRPVPPVVFPQVFDGSDRQNEDHRSQSKFWLKRIDDRDEIQQSDEDKVNIGEAMKLFKKILWQERQHSVLGRLNLVVCIVSVWVFLSLGVVVE